VPDTLLLFEVKANFEQPRQLRPPAIERFAERIRSGLDSPEQLFVDSGVEAEIASQRLDLAERLNAGDLRPQLIYVTTASAPRSVRDAARALGVELHSRNELVDLALALDRSDLLDETIEVGTPSKRRFLSETAAGRIAVCDVPAIAIAEWPGIEDRSLFGLNVRHELGGGRVRGELDAAIKNPSDHPNFLAFHNGLTAICNHIEEEDGALKISGISVVNGAQSVIAFHRNREVLTEDLHVLVKFVEAGDDPDLPGEVARRSNTQNAVNPRNLRALDGRQQLLEQQFARHPEFAYVVRPDTLRNEGVTTIANDDAAQWLCALYLARPWLAVKRTELFRTPTYQQIFHRQISATEVILAWRVRDAVQATRPDLPEPYRRSWRLVALVALYLVGELMRADDQDLSNPGALLNRDGLDDDLAIRTSFVAQRLCAFHEAELDKGFDDFKVTFKNQPALRALSNDVTAAWRRRKDG
jgi:hypothetical protein